MKKNIKMLFRVSAACLAIALSFAACQKMERPELVIIPDDPSNPGGTLKRYFAFENSTIDSNTKATGTATNVTYVTGIKGMAYKGTSGAYISYPTASQLSDLKSFTVSLWINTQRHTGGAQNVFMLPRTSDFWGNMFMMIEGNAGPTDSMLVKFHFAGNWIEFTNTLRLPDMYGKWRHLAFSYDATTSKFSAYLDGVKRNLPATMTDRKNSSGGPLGSLQLKDVNRFVIGGFQQHIGLPNGTTGPDAWMLNYTGMLDNLRIYNKALADTDITYLFQNKL